MYTVLICDDDKDIVSALDIYLTSEGYRTLKAYDGLECLKLVEEHEVHLILLDVMMPGLDGIRTTAKLREKRNIPIILLTAKSEDSDKVLGLNIGADDYVTKPFNPIEVIARVKSQLRRYTTLGGQQHAGGPAVLTNGGIRLDDAALGSENTVAVHIRHLREKLEIDPANPRYLKVVWGLGYKMEKL